ncbi:MAG: hypothetical protein C3F06_01610 [Candidatus Methanoperedenaceae archaeon]|nr:MAG: hypothetical protein C3F06_01610 [Candidatus Methanoperedenaceae archaeon]
MAEIETKAETVVKIMTPDERKRVLIEGIKKTVVPAFLGAFFAFIFNFKFGHAQDVLWFSVFLLVLLLSYYIQRLIYPSIGVRVKEFETKDWLYVEIFTIIFFWVFWTLLLNN